MATSKAYGSNRAAGEAGRGPKTVTFYINGNRNFQGHVMVITPRRFRDYEVLLNELSRLSYFKDLPLGVRYLFALENGTKVASLDQLNDGKAYVCSSHSRLKKMSYGGKPNLPHWGSRQQFELPAIQNNNNHETKPRGAGDKMAERSRQRGYSDPKSHAGEGRIIIKPKIVTVIRNGNKPRAVVKALLNKRTAQELEQVLNDISDSVGNAGGRNVRRLYTIKGQPIRDVIELFRDDNNVFIAVGNEKLRADDIPDILEDLEQSPRKQNGKQHPKASNEGMFKQRDVKDARKITVEEKREPVQNEPDNASSHAVEEGRLPKLPDIHQKPENKLKQGNNKPHVQANAKVKRSPHEKHQQRSNDKKQHNAVKLPQIGNQNLVAKSQKENHAKEDISKASYHDKNVSSLQNANDKPHEEENVNKEGLVEKPAGEVKVNRKTSVSKRSSNDKINKKTSRDDSGIITEDEIKYTTITDKKVEDVFYIGKKIGDGNFAEVRECTDKITKKEYALKIVDKDKIRGKEQMIKDEIDIMRRCRHPNIVRMYDDFDTTRHKNLVMELVKGGDLFDAISSSVKFTESVTQTYVKDMCKSLAYLHKRKIVHRDVKPENLLVHKRPDGQTLLKLADFGLAMEVKAPIFTVCGTPTYVAPEILEEGGYGIKVDMWAVGVITYIMLCGFPPFRSAKRDQDELFDLIMEGDYEFLSPYWDHISNDAKDLISKLLVVKPSERYSAEQVLSHPWIGHKSDSASGLSREFLGENPKARRKFKAAALAVRGAKRLENLAEQFQHQRGEKIIIT